MNRRIVTILGILSVPVGAVLLNACGPEGMNNSELGLDEASDNWASPISAAYGMLPNSLWGEYGHCLDTWDNDGNGLVDMADPNCHIAMGPLRDLSLFDFPEGHNFFPDIANIVPGGPGWGGGFRDREQIARWLRFLTEPDGNVAGIDVYTPGVNPEVVPLPARLPEPILQGTAAQGNNNNLSLRALHAAYMDHEFLPPPAPVVGAAVAPSPVGPGAEFNPTPPYNITQGFSSGSWPGLFYQSGTQGGPVPVPRR